MSGSGKSESMIRGAMQPRKKKIQFLSISPLDRLLNQRGLSDEVRVQVSCNSSGGDSVKSYDLTLGPEGINMLTCYDNTMLKATEQCEPSNNHQLVCDAGENYVIELFDIRKMKVQKLSTPPTLGSFTVTKEMMECLPHDLIQVNFEYGSRQDLAGAVACFDHEEYIHQSTRNGRLQTVEDEIPFTVLNICNKNSTDRKRCFLYSYQIHIHVEDDSLPPLIEPRIYAQITFKSFKNKMIILPGDQIKARFVTDYTDQEALRIQPEIHSAAMPEPFKSRYQKTDGIYLPCDDMKVADSITCTDFTAHCAEPEDRIIFTLQGAGDMFLIDKTCREFFSEHNYFPWDDVQNLLSEDVGKFEEAYKDKNGKLNKFEIKQVTFQNKYGVDQTENDWFQFDYSVWWRVHSNEPRCFAGDHLSTPTPVCEFECGGQQCLLEEPVHSTERARGTRLLSEVTSDDAARRLLQTSKAVSGSGQLAGPDVRPATEVNDPKYRLPLKIPTRALDPQRYVVPERLMNIYLSGYEDNGRSQPARSSFLIEAEVEEGKAAPINLSSSFEEVTGTGYSYNVTDKVKLDNAPPAAIEITKLPKKGKIIAQQMQGGEKELKVGDIITTKALNEFKYDQGDDVCTSENKENCEDSFSYITYSSWVGKGPESQSVINLKPVLELSDAPNSPETDLKSVEQMAAVAPIVPPTLAKAPEVSNSELASVQSPQIEVLAGPQMASLDGGVCLNQYPSALVGFMTVIIIMLITLIAGIVSYYFYLKKQGLKKASEEDFDDLSKEKAEKQLEKSKQDNLAEK